VFLKYGFVEEIGTGENLGQVRVRFPEDDDLVSNWLQVLCHWTKTKQAWNPPAKQEQVACLVDAHAESGVVLGAVYSELDKSPEASEKVASFTFVDGTTIRYNQETKEVSVETQGDIKVCAKGDITLDCAEGKNILIGGGNDVLVKKSWMTALESKVNAIDQAIGPSFAAVGASTAAAGALGQSNYETTMASARASYSSSNGTTVKLKGG
jgi:phage baseplate assembly protein V